MFDSNPMLGPMSDHRAMLCQPIMPYDAIVTVEGENAETVSKRMIANCPGELQKIFSGL
jgi:hypothetical protein